MQDLQRLGRLQAEQAAHQANKADRDICIAKTAQQLGLAVPRGGAGGDGAAESANSDAMLAALATRTEELDRQCAELKASNR